MHAGPALVAVLLFIIHLTAAGSAFAFRPGSDIDHSLVPALEQSMLLVDAEQLTEDASAVDFQALLTLELGANWNLLSWNQFARSPHLVSGPGVSVAPDGLGDATPESVERLAREFIAAHSDLFGTDGANLELYNVARGLGKWGVVFIQTHDSVPVMGSKVLLALHDNGNLFGFGADVYGGIAIPTAPTLEAPVAVAVARSALAYAPGADLVAGPDALEILPIHHGPGDVEYRLVHRTDVPTVDPMGVWRTYVDAHTGEIVRRTNEIDFAYHGQSMGDVEILSYCDGDTPGSPFARMDITINAVGVATTGPDGTFSIAGNGGNRSFNAEFNGPYFDVDCINCGGDATITGSIAANTPEAIQWDAASYRADERDAFYFANRTRLLVESVDPTFALAKYTVNVNVDETCNATHQWAGRRLNFFREGGGCANTARLGDVVAHEYGHGIQGELLGNGAQGQEGLGEGNADIAGTFLTGNPQMAIGYNSCDYGLIGRNCDNDLVYPDDLVGVDHSDGRIICGFNWDVWQNLVAELGEENGKELALSLWHYSRKLWGSPGMTQPDQAEFYRWADDENGNLVDGTPHWDPICMAASKHGYGCPPNPNRIEIIHTPLSDVSSASGPHTVEADITVSVNGIIGAPDEVELVVAVNGAPFTPAAMSHIGGGTYQALIPPQPAGTALSYYIRAAHGSGLEACDPEGAPAAFHLFGVGPFDVVAEHSMEIDEGWSVGAPGDNATDGFWVRDDPTGVVFSYVYQPEDDHTPSPGVNCWVTGNPVSGWSPLVKEVDGRTTLMTPVFDLAGATMLRGHVWAFTFIEVPANGDYLDVDMTTDAGQTWANLHHIDASTSPDWQQYTFRLSSQDYNFSDQTRFRFVAEDVPADDIVEALVDDFQLEALFGSVVGIAGPASPSTYALRLGHAAPNPFNPSTVIEYSLAAPSQVALNIYDVRGRLIRTLAQGPQNPGRYEVRWDGRDQRHAPVASGVYYYKLTVGSWSDTRSVVLLK